MQISGKMLLNSAEGILRERRDENRGGQDSGVGKSESSATLKPDGLNPDTIQVRLLNLQASLSGIQNEYSREQARHSYLSRTPEAINSSLRFNDSPLFPELETGISLREIEERVVSRLQELDRALKAVQVEMENLYALNFNALPQPGIEPGDLAKNQPVRALDPTRVARLTRE